MYPTDAFDQLGRPIAFFKRTPASPFLGTRSIVSITPMKTIEIVQYGHVERGRESCLPSCSRGQMFGGWLRPIRQSVNSAMGG